MRPIIQAVGSFNPEASSTSSSLSSSQRHIQFYKRNTKNDLQGCVMPSFDVKSLFKNISLNPPPTLLSNHYSMMAAHNFRTSAKLKWKFAKVDLPKHYFPIQWQILQTNWWHSNGFAYCSSTCWHTNELHCRSSTLAKNNVPNKPIVLCHYTDQGRPTGHSRSPSLSWSITPDFALNWQNTHKEHFSTNIPFHEIFTCNFLINWLIMSGHEIF